MGLASLVVSAGFYLQWSWATDLWPWPDSRLSYIFLASILAAVALPVIWIGLSGELGAAEAGGLDLSVTYGGMGAYLFGLEQPGFGVYAAVFAVACLVSVAIAAWAHRVGIRDPRPMPAPVRVSFGGFAAVLIVAGAALLLETDVFPWPLRSESSVMFGWIFLGAAVYFLHGVLRPSWANAAGQLIGFLIYGLILISRSWGASPRPVRATS